MEKEEKEGGRRIRRRREEAKTERSIRKVNEAKGGGREE